MGYYSTFELEITLNELPLDRNSFNSIKEEIEDYTDYGDMLFNDSIKWPHCEDDMKVISERHPELLFTLITSGEDNETGCYYFKEGKGYYVDAEISYPKFDQTRIK